MSSENEFLARGKVIKVEEKSVVFAPSNSSYELHLEVNAKYDGPADTLVDVRITAKARKVWTVPSGGNFVTPIMGAPRIVQGRVRHLTDRLAVIQASAPILVELPADDNAYDMNNGPITVGRMLNATLLPGAKFEFVSTVYATA